VLTTQLGPALAKGVAQRERRVREACVDAHGPAADAAPSAEQQQEPREQAVASSQVRDERNRRERSVDAHGHLPRLEELLARQHAGRADCVDDLRPERRHP